MKLKSKMLGTWGIVCLGLWSFFPGGDLRAAQVVEGRDINRPNIVLIMADDLGYECIGADGGTSYQTPVLDRLARTGIRFEHCYAQPLCTPSRVKLMTGVYNVRNYEKFGLLPRNQITFANLLKEKGYATCIAGKWQLGKQADAPRHFGFDESCLWQHMKGRTDKEGRDTRFSNPRLAVNGRVVRFRDGEYGPSMVNDYILDFISRHKDKPFLVYYPMILTHCPFVPTPDSADWDPDNMGSKSYKGRVAYFDDMVEYMDKMVGKVIARLDELGIRENTLVLFTGDNGTDQPVVSMLNGREVAGGKGSMTDAGTRVPLIASWPGTIPAGHICSDLVDFSDFLPTLCEVSGTPVPETLSLDGRSFLPQLKGEKGNPRDWIYVWYSRHGGPTGQEWTRNQRYKLYRTGKFYDIADDPLEEKPLKSTALDEKVQRVHAMLQNVLTRFQDARPLSVSQAARPKRKN